MVHFEFGQERPAFGHDQVEERDSAGNADAGGPFGEGAHTEQEVEPEHVQGVEQPYDRRGMGEKGKQGIRVMTKVDSAVKLRQSTVPTKLADDLLIADEACVYTCAGAEQHAETQHRGPG